MTPREAGMRDSGKKSLGEPGHQLRAAWGEIGLVAGPEEREREIVNCYRLVCVHGRSPAVD